MRVLVTGGAGFIGSHIVDQLVELGVDVVVLDREPTIAQNRKAEYRGGSVSDPEGWIGLLDGVDAVCHQAAKVGLGHPLQMREFVQDNDVGTAGLLWALVHEKWKGRLVLASSMTVYGEGTYWCGYHHAVRPAPRTRADLDAGRYDPRCPQCGDEVRPITAHEDDHLDPLSVYAATKLHQEHLSRATCQRIGVPVTALRYHNVYGPRMPRNTSYTGVASIWMDRLRNHLQPQVFEDGRQQRDFVHVSDVARANVLALTCPDPVEGALNVASGDPHSVLEMAAAMAARFGGPAPVVVGGYRDGDVRHMVASPERAAKLLGFTARVSFAEGVSDL